MRTIAEFISESSLVFPGAYRTISGVRSFMLRAAVAENLNYLLDSNIYEMLRIAYRTPAFTDQIGEACLSLDGETYKHIVMLDGRKALQDSEAMVKLFDIGMTKLQNIRVDSLDRACEAMAMYTEYALDMIGNFYTEFMADFVKEQVGQLLFYYADTVTVQIQTAMQKGCILG